MNESKAWKAGSSFDTCSLVCEIKYQGSSALLLSMASNNPCSSNFANLNQEGNLVFHLTTPGRSSNGWLFDQLIHPRHAKQVSTERVLIRVVDIVKAAEVVGPQRRPHVVETAQVEVVDEIRRRHVVVVVVAIIITVVVWPLLCDRRCTARTCCLDLGLGVAAARP